MNNFYKRSGLSVALWLLVASICFAQTNISGTVTDATGETLAGVNIQVKGRVIGTISDTRGNYSLTVNDAPPLTLVFSFMGYTTQKTDLLIGLGMSAISDSWFGFAQNDKSVEGYQQRIQKGELPIFRGHLLSDQDLEIRKHILDLMCHFETELDPKSVIAHLYPDIKARLLPMFEDQLVTLENNILKVTPEGIPFVRNCCMAFDQDLKTQVNRENLFSKTI